MLRTQILTITVSLMVLSATVRANDPSYGTPVGTGGASGMGSPIQAPPPPPPSIDVGPGPVVTGGGGGDVLGGPTGQSLQAPGQSQPTGTQSAGSAGAAGGTTSKAPAAPTTGVRGAASTPTRASAGRSGGSPGSRMREDAARGRSQGSNKSPR